MKKILLSLAAVAALSSAAFASSGPRCWSGQDGPSCAGFQSTNATGNDSGPLLDDKNRGNDAREFDHERETTRPY